MVIKNYVCNTCGNTIETIGIDAVAPPCCGVDMCRDYSSINLDVSKGTRKNLSELHRKAPSKSNVRGKK